MFSLFRFGHNPFNDPQLSIAELGRYGVMHVALMTADPIGGQLDAEIAATATVLEGLDVTLSDGTVKLGVQKARTGAKAEFRAGLPDPISRIYGAVVAKLGQKSAEMARFFPQGRTVFNQCAESMLDNKLTALRDALVAEETASPGSFPAAILTLANTLVETWEGLYGTSITGQSQREQGEGAVRAARQAVRTQFYRNVLKIATIFAGQMTADGQERGAERIAHYCPQHLLENKETPDAPNPPPGEA